MTIKHKPLTLAVQRTLTVLLSLFPILPGCVVALQAQSTSAPVVTITSVAPTTANAALKTEFDEPTLLFTPASITHPELVLFLPGTFAKPENYNTIQAAIAAMGFRVVALMYNDNMLVGKACLGNDSPACPGLYREQRAFGDAPNPAATNTASESIAARLASFLEYEAKTHPEQGWSQYLVGDQPAWSKIIVSGHSQGAGMAAYIAKYREVARAVLFSGGPDGVGRSTDNPQPAAWVLDPTDKTPADRWWAGYHVREGAAALLPRGFALLHIPPAHITQFALDKPATASAPPAVVFHMVGTGDARYQPEWEKMFTAHP